MKDSHDDIDRQEVDNRRVSAMVTKEDYAGLIADLVGHPQEAPTVEELDFVNPSMGTEEIQHRLEELRAAGIVRSQTMESQESGGEDQHEFYELTDVARQFVSQSELFPKEAWQRQYASVQKPPRILSIESIQRPDCQ